MIHDRRSTISIMIIENIQSKKSISQKSIIQENQGFEDRGISVFIFTRSGLRNYKDARDHGVPRNKSISLLINICGAVQ